MVDLPTIDMIATGQNINRLRKQAGLSVKDLQDIFGFATPQAIYKWQQGVALPSIDNLVVLAAILQDRPFFTVASTPQLAMHARQAVLITRTPSSCREAGAFFTRPGLPGPGTLPMRMALR